MQHINKKILDSIQKDIRDYYDIYICNQQWCLFKKPIVDAEEFNERQKVSIDIIHAILKHHGKEDILRFLSQLAEIEPNIQKVQPWVRDHIVHAINTFLLGVYILKHIDSCNINDYSFVWKLSGATHDLGYPIEISKNIGTLYTKELDKILDEIGSLSPRIEFKNYPGKLNLLENGVDANTLIQECLNKWCLDIDIADYYKWLNSKHKTDHGVISALSQTKVIDALYQKNNPERKREDIVVDYLNYNQDIFLTDIIESSSAIFIHNIKDEYKQFKINFERAPIAFLLYLCDNFQEWDRYTKKKDKIYSGETFDIQCNENLISLFTPPDLHEKVFTALSTRLSGFAVKVNGVIAVE